VYVKAPDLYVNHISAFPPVGHMLFVPDTSMRHYDNGLVIYPHGSLKCRAKIKLLPDLDLIPTARHTGMDCRYPGHRDVI